MNNRALCPSSSSCLSLLAPLSCLGETVVVPYPPAYSPCLTGYLLSPSAADPAVAVVDLDVMLEVQRLCTSEWVRRVRVHDQWRDNIFPFVGDLSGVSFDRERLLLT